MTRWRESGCGVHSAARLAIHQRDKDKYKHTIVRHSVITSIHPVLGTKENPTIHGLRASTLAARSRNFVTATARTAGAGRFSLKSLLDSFTSDDFMPAKFYVVKQGRTPGIYHDWNECLAQVKGFKGAVCQWPSM